MLYKQINYTADGRVNLQTYIPEKLKTTKPRPAMIACPGGAWTWLSPAENYFQIISAVHGGENLGSYFAGGCDGDPGDHYIDHIHLENAYQFGAGLI